jgi:hypothetical protein
MKHQMLAKSRDAMRDDVPFYLGSTTLFENAARKI